MKAVSDPATLDVIVAAYRCSNKAFTWESGVRDDTSRVPLLAWFCELAVPAAVTKPEDCRWQITLGTNLLEARSI
jgi:hypothetical protein